MSHEVIMPALGMAQDTGKLVQWLKAPGDAVATGEPLFEVETDKSVMEVEAQADGFLNAVSAADGEDVPVGQVIALIGTTAEAGAPAKAQAASTPEPAPEPEVSPAPAAPQAAAPAPAAAKVPAMATGGRVLASPKARRLALEEGLDLGALAAAGHPQPYHVSDLTVLRDLPAPSTANQTVVMVATKQITARVPRSGALQFIDWMQSEGGVTVTPTAMFASFASGAWRAATDAREIIVGLAGAGAVTTAIRNPDANRMTSSPLESEDPPTFVLHDLSDSFLTSLRLGDPSTPTISIGADGESFVLTFEFSSEHLSDNDAIAVISGLAKRLSDPLYHLV